MSDFNEFDDLDIQGSPDVEEKGGTYETLPDGDYQVNGIEDYITKAEDDTPTFVPDSLGRMVARGHYRRTDGGPGVPFSATKSEIAAAVYAFGGDPGKLPNETSPRFLISAQKLANEGGKSRTSKVKGGKGWSRSLAGAFPSDKESYTWKLAEVRSLDRSEPVAFQEASLPSKNGGSYSESRVWLTLEIVADRRGKPTPFAGWRVDLPLKNPFADYYPGQTKPATKIGPKGGIPVEVKRFLRMRELFLPAMKHQWQSDPEKSALGINEVENPIAVYADEMLKAGRTVLGKITITDKGYAKLDPMDLEMGDEPIDLDQQAAEAQAQSSALFDVVVLIDSLASFPVFESTPKNSNTINLVPTPEGIPFLMSKVAPVWDEIKLPLTGDKRMLGSLTPEQCKQLYDALKAKYAPVKEAAGGF